MIHRIDLIVVGDGWFNQDQIREIINSVPLQDTIVFSTRHEGPSLYACGFVQFLQEYVIRSGKNPGYILIDTPNQIEKLPYQFYKSGDTSHFFSKKLVKYHSCPKKIDRQTKLFGLFVGRYTKDRNMMIRDMLQYNKHFLFSVLFNDQTDLNNPCTETYDSDIWNIGSVDNMCVSDQFAPGKNTNASLMRIYDQFQIEIVAETNTRGSTFFPTEKTVRPIMGSKPLIVFGPVDFLENLKKMGFHTFHKLWCEDYDRHEGVKRWNLMKKTIMHIVENGYDVDFAQQIVDHNYVVLQDLLNNG
jgi:hypothetical protein